MGPCVQGMELPHMGLQADAVRPGDRCHSVVPVETGGAEEGGAPGAAAHEREEPVAADADAGVEHLLEVPGEHHEDRPLQDEGDPDHQHAVAVRVDVLECHADLVLVRRLERVLPELPKPSARARWLHHHSGSRGGGALSAAGTAVEVPREGRMLRRVHEPETMVAACC